jgi:hypothetical protein
MWPNSAEEAPTTARAATLYRCLHCYREFTGEHGATEAAKHAMMAHDARHPPAVTVYAPSIGVFPRGGDA